MRHPWAFQRWAFEQQTGNPVRKALLSMLAMMADAESGRCEAKVATLAAGTELSERSVQNHLKALESAGLLARRVQYRRDGSQRGNEFLLLAPWVREWPDGETAGINGVQDMHGCTDVHPGAQQRAPQELPLKNDHASKQVGKARARVDLPEGFPEELRPHLKGIYRALRDLAERQGAKAVAPLSLASVVMARPHKPLVRCAHDYVAWADGKAAKRKDVVAGYRNWLNNEDDLAGIEPVDSEGHPLAAASNGNRPANGRRPLGILEQQVWPDGRSWPELTREEQFHARDLMSRGIKPWLPQEEPAQAMMPWGNGKPVTAATILDDDD